MAREFSVMPEDALRTAYELRSPPLLDGHTQRWSSSAVQCAAAPRLLHASHGEGAMQDGEPWRLPSDGSDAPGSLRREKNAAGTLQLQPR